MWFVQLFVGGTWLHVQEGGMNFYVRKDRFRKPGHHYLQKRRRFVNYPWTPQGARSTVRWPILSDLLDYLAPLTAKR